MTKIWISKIKLKVKLKSIRTAFWRKWNKVKKKLNIKFSNTFCQYNLKVTEYVVCCLNIFLYEWMTLFVNNSIAVCFASFGLIKLNGKRYNGIKMISVTEEKNYVWLSIHKRTRTPIDKRRNEYWYDLL